MVFPAWIFLIPYGFFLLIAILFLFLNVYHMSRYGLQTLKTTGVIGVYFLTFFLVLGMNIILLGRYDWSTDIEIQNLFQLNITGEDLELL
jgi:hypothetical protein